MVNTRDKKDIKTVLNINNPYQTHENKKCTKSSIIYLAFRNRMTERKRMKIEIMLTLVNRKSRIVNTSRKKKKC